MKRKNFLMVGAWSLLGVGFAGWLRRDDPKASLRQAYAELCGMTKERKAAILVACFPHLDIAQEAGLRFVEDHLQYSGESLDFRLKAETLKRFLLSTDFVQQSGRGEIRYVAYYSPWRTPCYNPFSLRPRA